MGGSCQDFDAVDNDNGIHDIDIDMDEKDHAVYGANTMTAGRNKSKRRRRCMFILAVALTVAMAVAAAVVAQSAGNGGGNNSKSSITDNDNETLFNIPNQGGSNGKDVTNENPISPYRTPRPTQAPVAAPVTVTPVAVIPAPAPIYLAPNNDCVSAIGPLTVAGPVTIGTTYNSTISMTPTTLSSDNNNDDGSISTCGQVLANGQGVWYHVTGGDEVLRASTCHEQSDFDTQLSIFVNGNGNDDNGNNDNNQCDNLKCMAGSDEFCGSQSSASWFAAKGVTYYIYVHGWGDAAGTFGLTVDYEENGSCFDAIGPMEADGSVVTGSLRGASQESFLSCDAVPVNNGVVWYSVYGTGAWMEASTCHGQTEFAARIAIVKGACASIQCAAVRDTDCGNGYRAIWKTNPGELYHMLVFKESNFPGTIIGLSITQFEPVVNDKCVNAVPVTVGGSGNLVKGSTLQATIDNAPSRACGARNLQPGVWFSVQGTGGKLLASTCYSETETNFGTEIAIFRGECSDNSSSTSSSSSSSIANTLECVTAGDQFCGEKASVYWDSVEAEMYYIFVHGADYGLFSQIGNFGLTVDTFVPEVNDVCETAIALDPTGDRLLGSTFSATDDGPSRCDGIQSDAPGVWYSVTTTSPLLLRASTCDPETDFDTQISIFRGSCGSLTCVITDDNSCGFQSSVAWSATADITYYIFVHGRESTSSGDFAIIIEEYSPAVSNDFCDNAVAVFSDGSQVTGSTGTATFDNAAQCVVENTGPGVWYTVEGTGTFMIADLCNDATTYDSAISIFSGDCLNLECVAGNRNGESEICGSKSQTLWISALNTTYYVFVHGWGTRAGNFGLTVQESPSAVLNDFCVRAVQLSISSTVTMGSTIDATVSKTPICSGVASDAPGVWYQVTGNGNRLVAATCNGDLNGQSTLLTDFDTQISVFRGGCGNLECVAGDDNGCGLQSRAIWQSVVGEIYYVHVHGARGRSGNYGLIVDNFVSQQANDACSSARGPLIPDGKTVSQGTTFDASFDDVGFCGTTNSGPGVWFFFVGTGERFTADTCDSRTNFDTKLSIFSGFDCSGLTCVTGIDDGCGLQSSISFETEVGETYWLLLHGWESNNVGNYALTLSGSAFFGSFGGT